MDEKLRTLFIQNNGYLMRNQLPNKSAYNRLLKLVGEGTVERIKQGVYFYRDASLDNTMIDIEKVIPNGVLCLFSAWSYYGLLVNVPESINIAIEKSRKIVLPSCPEITLFYWKRDYYEIGVTNCITNNYLVRIYDMEKSVCDAIKYRTKIGMETMSEILKTYLKRRDCDLPKLLDYAKRMRTERILKRYLEVML